jgi:hypothetical protein
MTRIRRQPAELRTWRTVIAAVMAVHNIDRLRRWLIYEKTHQQRPGVMRRIQGRINALRRPK